MKSESYFYLLVASLFVALMVIGFYAFYARGTGFGGRVITPEVCGVVIVHGVAITFWYLCEFMTTVDAERALANGVTDVGVALAPCWAVFGFS